MIDFVPRRPPSLLARALRSLVLLGSTGVACATGLSFLASSHWTLDLLTHFRPHLAFAGILLLGIALLSKTRPGIALAAFTLLANGAFLLPDVSSTAHAHAHAHAKTNAESETSGPQVKLLMANVLTGNPDATALRRLIRREDPDVIGLLEVDEGWVEDMRYLRGHYAHHLADPRSDNFGIALYSRFPLRNARLENLGGVGLNAIMAGLEFEDRHVEILLAHPVPPAGSVYSTIRNSQLLEIATLRRRHDAGEFVVIGDLNTTPWSPHFRALIAQTGLRRARVGYGYAATWPTTLAAPIRIPIDHALVSPGLETLEYRVGPEIGSDHLPIIARLAFKADSRR